MGSHGAERDGLRRFGDAENYTCVLNREKAFWYVNIKKDCANKSGDRDEQRCGAVAKDDLQRAAIKGDDGIERVLGFPVEPGLLFFSLMTQELGAHHRRKRQRDNGGNENRNRECDSKFAEKAADDVAHKE